jgi:hypothetical protein
MKAAAVRRIYANGARHIGQPCISATLGAVAMNDMGGHFARTSAHVQQRLDVARPEMPAHGNAGKAEGERSSKLRKPRLRLLASG